MLKKNDNRKVAFFLPNFYGGGAEKVMVQLAGLFADRNIAVDFVVGCTEGPNIAALSQKVNLINLEERHVSRCLFKIVQYFNLNEPSAVLSTLMRANVTILMADLIARGNRRVVVREAVVHESRFCVGPGLRGRLVPLLARHLYGRASAIVAVSAAVKDGICGLINESGRSPISVIYNPINIEAVKTLANERVDHPWFDGNHLVVLSVGRLEPQKGFDALIAAFARLHRNNRSTRLIILGEGGERLKLANEASELGVANAVDMPGFVQNPFPFMKRASVFVSSSRREGLPNSLLQALSLGVSVVATDCPGGSREILKGGRLGRMVPVDQIEIMADALRTVIQAGDAVDEKLLADHLRLFDEDAAVDAYLEILFPVSD